MSQKIRVVGKRKPNPRPAPEELDAFFHMLEALRPTPNLVPRGVYRFTSFEDAQEWMSTQIARTVRLSAPERQPRKS